MNDKGIYMKQYNGVGSWRKEKYLGTSILQAHIALALFPADRRSVRNIWLQAFGSSPQTILLSK